MGDFFRMKIHGVLAAQTGVESLQVTSRSAVVWWFAGPTFLSLVTNRASTAIGGGPPFYLMSQTELLISHKICLPVPLQDSTWRGGSNHINVFFCLLWICAWCYDHKWFFLVWKFIWFSVLKYLYDYHWKVLMFRKYLYYAICGNIIIIEKCWCFREYFCELQYVGM